MGPNAITLLQEALVNINTDYAKRVLDLGCGMGLTSMYLADHTRAINIQVMVSRRHGNHS